jgi:hypothetical protein
MRAVLRVRVCVCVRVRFCAVTDEGLGECLVRLWQVPAHKSLERKFDLRVHAWLINSNWLRTVAWSARLGLLLYALFVSF